MNARRIDLARNFDFANECESLLVCVSVGSKMTTMAKGEKQLLGDEKRNPTLQI
jgi:hypothetical protein